MLGSAVNIVDPIDFSTMELFTRAIQKGVRDSEGYPFASIQQPTGHVAIKCHKSDETIIQQFDAFLEIFPELCEKNNILPLENRELFKKPFLRMLLN